MNPDTSRSFFFFLGFFFVRFKEWDVYVKGVIVDSSVIINLLKPLWLIIRALFKFFNWCLTNFDNILRIVESKYRNFNHTVKFAIKMQTLQRHRFRRSSVIMKGHVAKVHNHKTNSLMHAWQNTTIVITLKFTISCS